MADAPNNIANFEGTWACASADGFTGFLKDLGIGMIKRNAAHAKFDGGKKFKIKIVGTSDTEFTTQNLINNTPAQTRAFGAERDCTVGQDQPATCICSWDGDKLVITSTITANKKVVVCNMKVNDDKTGMTHTLMVQGGKTTLTR